jgi:hypothetical protein
MAFHLTKSSPVSFLCGIYVDDFRIISDSQDEVDKLKTHLAPHGAVEVDSNRWRGLTINHDCGLTDCKPMNTSAAPGTKAL